MVQKGFYILFGIFIFFHGLAFSQEGVLQDSFKIDISQGSLNSALQHVSDITGLRFAYRQSILDNKSTFEKGYHASLSEILDELVKGNGLCYNWQAGQVIIHTACVPKFYTVKGSVVEDSSFLPIPFVSVSILHKPIGVIGNQNGGFEMDVPVSKGVADTLVFSCLGFARDTLVLPLGENISFTHVLRRKVYRVPEILVKPKNYVTVVLGNNRERSSGSLYLDTHGQQVGLFVENKLGTENFIESLDFYLSRKGNVNAPFRVRVYDVDSTGKPGKDLIEDAVVVKPTGKEGWFAVNISMLDIQVPERGVFVAMEGVFPKDAYPFFGDTDSVDLAKPRKENNRQTLMYGQQIGYNRKCKDQTWHYSAEKVWFQLEKQAFGVMISARVKYESGIKNE